VWEVHEAPGKATAFLFTDIVGSTARWDADRAAMQEALRRHDAIVRAAIERSGGRVFKTVGDAFCAAFDGVGAALGAAVAAQRDIDREDWRAVNGLRVRMAVHAGEAEERDDDYFGPAVNRVARLLSAGHGGQVLVSGAAADLAAVNLPDGLGLRALGMLPLKDLKTPERVFQVTAEGLQTEFKPLRALDTPPNNLPRQISSFVGRHADVAQVEAMLRAEPFVTIVGTGGVGKTRLALAAAAGVLNDTREGAWFVDLAPIADPTLVSSTILTACGADQTSDVPAFDMLIAYLEKRGLLLVLDNCEHLIGEVARVAAAVLARCAQVTLLATSREALNVTGERVYRLSSLDDDAAVRLFADRAQAVNPAFSIDAENRATVEELCRRLDGIALAIELAAARMRAVSLDELARRLRLRMLVGGARDRQPRQQTMRALVDWSYELLASEERSLFRNLSVFAGGFTLEAAGGVFSAESGEEWEVLDGVTSLADKSLLAIETGSPERRYRLLEPIREFARERLDESGESGRVLERHAETFAAIADRAYVEWDSGPRPDWLARTAGDLDNFRAALAWGLDGARDPATGASVAAGTAPLFLRLSLLHEGIGWCERALQFAAQLPPASTARLYYGLSMLYHNQGANAKALSAARSGAEFYRAAGDERGLTRALSQIAHHLGDGGEAGAIAEEALARARALGDRRLLATTLQRCAFVYSPLEIEAARSRFAEAVELFRGLGRTDETARALGAWADAESNAGNAAGAVALAREAIETGPDDVKLFAVNVLASCYLVLNDRENALPASREALALATKGAHPVATPCAILYLAALESEVDLPNAARLAGFAHARLGAAGWELAGPDRIIEARLETALESELSPEERDRLRATGAGWSDPEGIAAAARV
jgi:predicted ATPase/class 3 adenylate cyclase